MRLKRQIFFSLWMLTIGIIWFNFTLAYALEEPYKIGVILTAGGAFAALGGPQKDGAFLAAEEINGQRGVRGHKIELIFEDDGGDPSVASRLAKKLIGEDHVSGIFGGTDIPAAHKIALECEEKRIPLIAPVPQRSVVKDRRFTFINTVTTDTTALAQAKYISEELKWRKVAIIHHLSEYGITFSTLLKESLNKMGVELFIDGYKHTETDFSPLLLRVRNFNPDGISLLGTIPSGPAIFLKNKKGLGIEIPVIGPTSLTTQTFINLAGEAGEGMLFQTNLNYDSPSQEAKEFFKAMARKYPGTFPIVSHAFGWDGIKLFAEAMKTAEGDPLKIRDALENIKGYETSRGPISLSPDDHIGFSMKNLSIVKLQKGRFVPVSLSGK